MDEWPPTQGFVAQMPVTFEQSYLPPTTGYDESYQMHNIDDSPPTFTDVSAYSPGGCDSSYLTPMTQPQYHNMYNGHAISSIANSLPDLGSDVTRVLDVGTTNFSGLSIEDSPPVNGMNGMHGEDTWMNGHTPRTAATPDSYLDNPLSNGSAYRLDMPAHGDVTVQNNMTEEAPPHHIEILEEPMEFGYRFRYEVEGKAHGGLQGRNSKPGGKKGAKKYPEIKVHGIPSHVDKVDIEARLVSATEDYYPHPNKCSGKDCNTSGIFRTQVHRGTMFSLTLNNLTILQIKKQDQQASLHKQLIDINDDERRMGKNSKTEQELLNKALELKDVKHNGVVRIRFQASFFDSLANKWFTASNHSQSVHDQKQANAAELRICRLSEVSDSCTGGKEVFILCEKVVKEDIKVKFKLGDWEAEGRFSGSDVHYQYAIVSRVPAYKDLDIQTPVEVKIHLFRPSTGTYSKGISFTYYPSPSDIEETQRKRKRPDSSGPSGMGGYPPYSRSPYDGAGGFGGGSGGGGSGGGGFNFPQSRGYTDPSIHGYNMATSTIPAAAHSSNGDRKPSNSNEEPMNLTIDKDVPSVIEEVEGDSSTKVVPNAKDVQAAPVVKTEPVTAAADSTEDDDLEADCAVTPVRSKAATIMALPPKAKFEVPQPKRAVGKMVQGSTQTQPMTTTQELSGEISMSEKLERYVLTCEDLVIDSVMNYASTGDHRYFISQFRHFLGVKDEYGDNSLHMAVINGQYNALKDMLMICQATNAMSAVNQANDKRQTPLHTAVILKNVAMVDLLLRHGADPTKTDMKGENCWHVAAKGKDHKTMQVLCQRYIRRDISSLNAVNYQGITPLILAVQYQSHNCVTELLNSGADVNIGDGTSGRTPLHHAVENGDIIIASNLLSTADADVNAQAYNGNTPLHLAVSSSQHHMVKLLIGAGADVDIENRETRVFEESDEEEEPVYITGLTPSDLPTENDEITRLLSEPLDCSFMNYEVAPENSIRNLTEEQKTKLAKLLEGDSVKDWMRLAQRFDLNCLIHKFEEDRSPTKSLLTYLGTESRTLQDLKAYLSDCGRPDCVAVIDGTDVDLMKGSNKAAPMSVLTPGILNTPSINLEGKILRSVQQDSGYASGYNISAAVGSINLPSTK